jgi:hypothetical protein
VIVSVMVAIVITQFIQTPEDEMCSECRDT